MKYNAHMKSGKTIVVEIDNAESAVRFLSGSMSHGWLVGESGEMIKVKYCEALVPILDEPTLSPTDIEAVKTALRVEAPPAKILVDDTGDRWELTGDGGYRAMADDGEHFPSPNWTREEIKEAYGIDHEQS